MDRVQQVDIAIKLLSIACTLHIACHAFVCKYLWVKKPILYDDAIVTEIQISDYNTKREEEI